ncbi:chromate transporter [Paenibacillus aurantius]|uniref:Chromate transporter n=1 Tax=Paenibacillus aurantius TaxID=2918900 RepID=A0AA96LDC0_9BACL|nr:chromate transporter [Paenibacillus aurantius]WNQ10006.1 chromate transporter [Paenibacillus aurantius]
MLWDLFWTFTKVGVISFGGGYAMIPVIEHEVQAHQWMTSQQFSQAVSAAGMAPGPIATNSAIFVGYQTAGVAGAAVSAAGIILPSFLLIILAAAFFRKVYKHRTTKSVFYGLRPVVTGLILYAAVHFAVLNGLLGGKVVSILWSVVIMGGALVALGKYKVHPLVVLLVSGLAGAAFFTV